MSRRVLAVITLALVSTVGAAKMEAQQSRPWIHVQVTDPARTAQTPASTYRSL